MTKKVVDQLADEQRRLSKQAGHSKERTDREVAAVRKHYLERSAREEKS
ncbi:hypothetical protein [Actinoplanes regularis]|nr:hypothetical protein [Actinoplanes regularis]GLW32298.1 hypothetical protein Areg01_52370 [Actinoplanes regularis]